jgi:hypothetical protein
LTRLFDIYATLVSLANLSLHNPLLNRGRSKRAGGGCDGLSLKAHNRFCLRLREGFSG